VAESITEGELLAIGFAREPGGGPWQFAYWTGGTSPALGVTAGGWAAFGLKIPGPLWPRSAADVVLLLRLLGVEPKGVSGG
jgi:hypothetical protein